MGDPSLAEPGFDDHLRSATAFSDRLAAARCRPSGRFDHVAQDAVGVLAPLLTQWIPDLLLVLRIAGPLRFNRIKERLEPLSSRVLTDKLRHMEDHGLVTRVAHEDGQRYSLTPHGDTVAALLHPLLFYLNQRTPDPKV